MNHKGNNNLTIGNIKFFKWYFIPAMLNLRPIGRVWPKGLFCSAKCTLTTEKSRDTFLSCQFIQFEKRNTFGKVHSGFSIMSFLKF